MARMRYVLILSAFVGLAVVSASFAKPKADNKEAAPKELRKPVEPADVVDTFKIQPGFRLELVAAEPLVCDPMAMEFDENGIAYVLEIPAYNEYGKPEPRTPGSIARLEDTDGDGRFDRRTTFAGDLKYPTGLFCYDGGLFVGDAPNLLYLNDTDGDGVADQREVLYTGFGSAQAGESQLNSFRWGLDNRIHINTGLDGGDIRPANEPDAPPRVVRNRRILLDPRTRKFDLTSGGGQHGMSFDDWGRVYVCDNSNPVQVITYDDRYIERNPLMSAPAPMKSLGKGKGFTKLVRVSEAENWRRIRLQLIEQGAEVTDTYEFDRPTGVFTSATGATVYRGDAWPEELRGTLFTGEVVNNLVYHMRIHENGLDLSTERLDGDSGFLASVDTWFRPVQFAHGPDGNLYMIDMYRELIEGIQWVPPEVVAKMDPTAGSDRGRIYRIMPEGFKQPPPVRLGDMSTAELVKQLESRNSWHRETAARLIYQRNDRAAVEPLRKLLRASSYPQARMHAMYSLDGLGALAADDVIHGLRDADPRVRQHALCLGEKLAESSADVRQAMISMIDDPDVAVRLQLAYSLGAVPLEERVPAIIELVARDIKDPRFALAIQSSLGTGAANVAVNLLALEELRQTAGAKAFLTSLANQIGRSKQSQDIRSLAHAIDELPADESLETLSKELVVAMLADGAGVSVDDLTALSTGRVKSILATLLIDARATALDANADANARVEAIKILGCGSFASQRDSFDELLTPQQPRPVQETVVSILGRFADAGVVELLIAKWPELTPGLRSAVAEVLLSRPAWAEALLAAVENNEVSPGDFDPARVEMLKTHATPSIRERASAVFANVGIARRGDVVASYQQALKLTGDPKAGKAAFQKTCAACHVLEGQGTAVGAELASIRDDGREAIMLNILDPNREINPKYLTYAATTNEGRVITGMITEETPNNITIRQADGATVPIPRTSIEEIESTGMSYMPEGLESQLDHQAMADLLAYIMSIGSDKAAGGK
jgi:putative membrane-bound dehydrogenase-like protein